LLDRLLFLGEIVQKGACPKCNFDKVKREVIPTIHPPYSRYLNLRNSFKPLWASNISDIVSNAIDMEGLLSYDEEKKKRSRVKVMILVDHT
jgi:hypothetical protein